MIKFYLYLLPLFVIYNCSAQCPLINGAMVNSCELGASEGINEYVFFTTTSAGTAANYTLYYGSGAIPKTSPTAVLSGATATTKIGTGTVTATGCSVIHVTSPSTVIPAGSRVLFIPYAFDVDYNVSGICLNGAVYVVYINTITLPSDWSANGNLANTPTGNRYLQLVKGTTECTSQIRVYNNSWPTNVNGNAISWNEAGIATYFNNGCTNIVTPVKLYSFNVAGNGSNAQVIWKTTTELNTASFEIERSVDGSVFKTIGKVQAAGNSSQLLAYAHTDQNIPTGSNYYRLKMIDRDGSYSYSAIVKIDNNRGRFTISNLYPTPANNIINIAWNAPKPGVTYVSILDMAGRLLVQKQIPNFSGMNNTNIDISSLPAAHYVMRLEKDGVKQVMSFSKQ